LHGGYADVICARHARRVIVFTRLRIDLPDHPGALAAVSRVLAAEGLNVAEVSIHEIDGARAVDEIVVHAPEAVDRDVLAPALQTAGAELLSVGPCETRADAVVTALTWVNASLEHPSRRSTLAAGITGLTGIRPIHVISAEEAAQWPVCVAAMRRGWPVVQRLDHVPAPLLETAGGEPSGNGRWVLAAPDAPEASYVVLAARPYAIRFTATELSRLVAVLDCRRQLMAAPALAALDSV
jgi:predicted amino acid-binding ACT domain protein